MGEWLLVVTLLMPVAGVPNQWAILSLSPALSTEADCLKAAADWPRWRAYHDGEGIIQVKLDVQCQQRADYEWSLDRDNGDGAWMAEEGE